MIRGSHAPALRRFGTLLALLGSADLLAASCDVVRTPVHAGADADVVLCGDSLPASIALRGLDEAGIEQRYLAPMGQCNWNDKRPGFHLVLKAPKAASAVPIEVVDAASGAPACDFKVDVLPPKPAADLSWVGSMPEETVKVVDVKGIRTRYFEKGNGPTLVLVHGGQSGGYNNHARKWEVVFPRLAKTFRVISLDRLGQGGTDTLPAKDYPNYYALDPVHLENFLDALKLKDVTLVGHSQGGWPVMRVALNRPDLVKCLVNVGTVLVPDDGKLMMNAVAFTRYVDGPVHPATGPTFFSARRALELRMVSGNNIVDSSVERVLENWQLKKDSETRKTREKMQLNPAHPSFIALKKQAYADIAAGKLKSRTLSIWGDRDLESPAGLGFPFHQALIDGGADAALVFVQGSGHSPHTEFPTIFTRTVVEHCAGDTRGSETTASL